jgi:hypothetical protein
VVRKSLRIWEFMQRIEDAVTTTGVGRHIENANFLTRRRARSTPSLAQLVGKANLAIGEEQEPPIEDRTGSYITAHAPFALPVREHVGHVPEGLGAELVDLIERREIVVVERRHRLERIVRRPPTTLEAVRATATHGSCNVGNRRLAAA